MNREPTPLHPLLARLREARETTDTLFSIVKPEFLYERPIAERHRIVFYIGHLEAFDRNLFDQRLLDLPSPNPEFDQLFAFGIDPVDGGLPRSERVLHWASGSLRQESVRSAPPRPAQPQSRVRPVIRVRHRSGRWRPAEIGTCSTLGIWKPSTGICSISASSTCPAPIPSSTSYSRSASIRSMAACRLISRTPGRR